MSFLDLISLAIHVTAVAAAVWYLRRTKDWRFLILAAIAVMMAIRHALIMSAEGPFDPAVFMAAAEDLPGFAESLLILIAIVAFGRLFGAQVKERVRLRDILSSASDLDWQVDARGRFEYISNRLAQITDEEVTALIGSRAIPVDPASGALPGGWAGLLETVMRREPFSEVITEVTRPDGEVLFLSTSGIPITSPIGEYLGCRGSSRDVTQRVKAERALQQSEAQLANAQRISHVGNWDWHADTQEFVFSDEMYHIFGLRKGAVEMTLESALSYIHPADVDRVRDTVARSINNPGAPPYAIEYRMIRPDGEVRVIHAQGEASFDGTGKIVRVSGTIQDISARKAAEEKMRLSHAALEASLDGIVLADANHKFTFVNESFVNLFGYRDRQEALAIEGKGLWKNPEEARSIVKALGEGKSFIGETLATRRDGAEIRLDS